MGRPLGGLRRLTESVAGAAAAVTTGAANAAAAVTTGAANAAAAVTVGAANAAAAVTVGVAERTGAAAATAAGALLDKASALGSTVGGAGPAASGDAGHADPPRPRLVRRAGRRVWLAGDRVHIPVRGSREVAAESLRRDVAEALNRHRAVKWAAVNAVLGVVIVDCLPGEAARPDGQAIDDLVALVDAAERRHRLPAAGPEATSSPAAAPPTTVPAHPATDRAARDTVAILAADLAGLSVATTGRLLRWVPLPLEVAALVGFVESQPGLRGAVQRVTGPERVETALALVTSGAQAAALATAGLSIDATLRVLRLREARARLDSWAQAEPLLTGSAEAAGADVQVSERPIPLPAGPVQAYCTRIGRAAVLSFAGVLAVSASPRRALGVAVATLPKAALTSIEAFGSALGRTLSLRGAVVVDPAALRRLDTVSAVVVEADAIDTGRLELGQLRALATATATATATGPPTAAPSVADLTALAYTLFDPNAPTGMQTGEDHILGPLDELRPGDGTRDGTGDGTGPAAADREAACREVTGTETVHLLGLARRTDRTLLAVVSVVPEQTGALDTLAAATRRSGLRMLLAADGADRAGRPGDPRRLADAVLPGGRALPGAVRALQADGECVLLVGTSPAALAAADIGVGLAGPDHAPPWGAHLLVPDLGVAATAIEAVGVARTVARRGVALARAGTAIGAAATATGQAPWRARRSLLGVNAASAAALAGGLWSANELAHRPVSPPLSRIPWHAMPPEVALRRLDVGPDGLAGGQVARRRGRPENTTEAPSVVRAFVGELANPLTPILAAGALLSAAVGSAADAGIVGGVMLASAAVGGVQRLTTDRAVADLLRGSATLARALRDGSEATLPADELVPGDVLRLASGDLVPADCRILDAGDLEVDESSLTGESLPVRKSAAPVLARALADRTSMLYEGTTVAAGRARAVVVATGSATEVGRSSAASRSTVRTSGVEARLAQLTRVTLPLAIGSAGAVILAGFTRRRPARDSVGAGVGLAVASVPEGLPFLVSAAQLAAARRLSAQGALVRNPGTIETLGRVDVLCFDKTGTLTEGRIALRLVTAGTTEAGLDHLDDRHRAVLAAALRATPQPRPGHRVDHLTDRAVLRGAEEAGVQPATGAAGWRAVGALPFDPSRGYHATAGETDDTEQAGMLLSVKGAPEVLLPRCRLAEPAAALAAAERLAARGYRVLAVAERRGPRRRRPRDSDVRDLDFAGFIAFADPVRSTAGASVRDLRDAGVQVLMITGDHPSTAEAIADELDVTDGGRIVTGAELDALDDHELDALLPHVSVVARGTPTHKVRVVAAFQRLGRTVAMTGDGANDAPAIRLADVGIALGRHGTPSARAAADLVVTDDRLETILAALVEGRAMWRSVRHALGILVGGNLGEIAFTVAAASITGSSPLSARQLLLVNLLTDLAPALAVALRPPPEAATATLLEEGPEASLGAALTGDIATRAVATAAGAGMAWAAARLSGRPRRARTVGLVALVGTQLGQTLVVGRPSLPVVAASVGSFAALGTVVQTPGLSAFFGCTPLGPVGWTLALGSATAATGASLVLPRLLPGVTEAAADRARLLQQRLAPVYRRTGGRAATAGLLELIDDLTGQPAQPPGTLALPPAPQPAAVSGGGGSGGLSAARIRSTTSATVSRSTSTTSPATSA